MNHWANLTNICVFRYKAHPDESKSALLDSPSQEQHEYICIAPCNSRWLPQMSLEVTTHLANMVKGWTAWEVRVWGGYQRGYLKVKYQQPLQDFLQRLDCKNYHLLKQRKHKVKLKI
jgi:hypothetical protein